MERFHRITAIAAPLDDSNVDTDQVIPARFLKKPLSLGYGGYLFHDTRFREDGTPKSEFILNDDRFKNARILVTGANFGCGSSREAAVWALTDTKSSLWFRAVVAPSFGDIFYSNACKNGLLPVTLPDSVLGRVRAHLRDRPGSEMTIDLEAQIVIAPDGSTHEFQIDPFLKKGLIEGVDEIELTLGYRDQISRFERARPRWSSRTRPLTIALLGGEGIGPEVVEATAMVLEKLLPDASFVRPIHGEPALAERGHVMPEETRLVCKSASAILFGATWKHCGDVIRFLRWGLSTYANIRPARSRPGLKSPLANKAPIDLVIVRENIEGEYPTREGDLAEFVARWPEFKDIMAQPMPKTGAFALRIATEDGARRIARLAANKAIERRARGRPGKVSVVTKQNVFKKTDGVFLDVARSELEKACVEHDHFYVDDAARRLVVMPERFDVILTPNLFGDVLSDIAAELIGGLGVAPSACIGETSSYFESVHGSAPDIAGKNVANPLATVLSSMMMLEHLGLQREAAALSNAVDRLLMEGRVSTPDLGGTARTTDVALELIRLLGLD